MLSSSSSSFFRKPVKPSPEDNLKKKSDALVILNNQIRENESKYYAEVTTRTSDLIPLLLDLTQMPAPLLRLIQSYDFPKIDSLFQSLMAPLVGIKSEIRKLEDEIEAANPRVHSM